MEVYWNSTQKIAFINVLQDHPQTFVELPLPDYIIPAPCVTRGNSMKFVHSATSIDPYKYSFFPNSISKWNKLLKEIINATSLNNFKILLESYL